MGELKSVVNEFIKINGGQVEEEELMGNVNSKTPLEIKKANIYQTVTTPNPNLKVSKKFKNSRIILIMKTIQKIMIHII